MKQLNKNPLCPAIILRFTGTDLTFPVVGKSNFIQLLTITTYILFSGHFRMLTGLNRILFGRQTEGIIAHRMQHIKSFQALITGNDIRSNITQRVTHVESGPGRIRKHVQYIILLLTGRFYGTIGVMLTPVLLPFRFNIPEIIIHHNANSEGYEVSKKRG